MIEICADALKQHGSAAVSPEEGIAVPVISVPVRAAVAWAIAVPLAVTLKATVVARGRRATVLAGGKITPRHTEGIFSGAALRIFNPYYCGTAIARLGDQILIATSIQPGELEVGWIRWHGSGTFKATPLRRGAAEIAHRGIRAPNFDFGLTIDQHRNGALAGVWIPSPNDCCPLRNRLSASDYG
jgi:hypothetical protein